MIALVLRVAAPEVELASDALWMLGVVAVEERSVGDVVELWTSLGDDEQLVAAVAAGLDPRWQWRVEHVDETVADTWRAHARPTWVDDDLVVVPAWIDGDPEVRRADVIALRIEPGSTFGLGDHPTTVLSMRALRREVATRPGCTVLDVGCGSGVLAIAAVHFGASSSHGLDIAPASLAITELNAATNAVARHCTFSNTPLADVAGAFDVVVANILAPALITMADDLRRVVAPGGALILSGLLADRNDHVVAAMTPLTVAACETLAGWAAITLRG